MRLIVAVLGVILLISVVGCTVGEELVQPEDGAVVDAAGEEEDLAADESSVVEDDMLKPAEERVDEIATETTEPTLVNGKTVEERLADAYANLHEAGSSTPIVQNFPDLELVYTDQPSDEYRGIFPPEILPFHYYYSEEADKTFNLCGVGRSVFICDGKLDRLLTKEDIDSGRCEITPLYLGDPRLGGSGFGGFRYG